MKVDKKRMLQWMYGVTRTDKIRNRYIKENVGVTYVHMQINTYFMYTYRNIKHIDNYVNNITLFV